MMRSGTREIQSSDFSRKKEIHSVNILILALLNGLWIYVSDCSPISHDQQQWKSLNLWSLIIELSNLIGIIGDKGFFFNLIDLMREGNPLIIGYKPRRKSKKSMRCLLRISISKKSERTSNYFIWSQFCLINDDTTVTQQYNRMMRSVGRNINNLKVDKLFISLHFNNHCVLCVW